MPIYHANAPRTSVEALLLHTFPDVEKHDRHRARYQSMQDGLHGFGGQVVLGHYVAYDLPYGNLPTPRAASVNRIVGVLKPDPRVEYVHLFFKHEAPAEGYGLDERVTAVMPVTGYADERAEFKPVNTSFTEMDFGWFTMTGADVERSEYPSLIAASSSVVWDYVGDAAVLGYLREHGSSFRKTISQPGITIELKGFDYTRGFANLLRALGYTRDLSPFLFQF